MAPLVCALEADPAVESVVCVTGQHRQMLDQVMTLFGLRADHDLNVMTPDQTLNGLFARVIDRIDPVLAEVRPNIVLVHGDTSTASAAALAAFHRKIQIGHVEDGLRTDDLARPFPEEMNRRVVDVVSDFMFAPTETSRQNLLAENLGGKIVVSGNTVIDALAIVCRRLDSDIALSAEVRTRFPWIDGGRRLLLVTGHRRESFGEGFINICEALADLASRPDIQIVYPVHLNPRVRDVVTARLGQHENVKLIEPVDYLDFVWLMRQAALILTDSGGVQEEAPFLGKPVLVMRDVTERPEAVRAGTVMLVGANRERIAAGVCRLLDNAGLSNAFGQRLNPYGDGHASSRIVAAICGRPFEAFSAFG